MLEFGAATPEEVSKVIQSSPNKTCELDVIPTILVKLNVVMDTLIPVITDIMNASMSSGIVPYAFKQAIVTSAIKKPNLDHNELKN